MRILSSLAAIAVMSALTARAVVLSSHYLNSGPVSFKLTASAQSWDYVPVSIKTNHTSTVTNVITTSKSTVTNLAVDSEFILRLLENSFNTNFPAGARLASRRPDSSASAMPQPPPAAGNIKYPEAAIDFLLDAIRGDPVSARRGRPQFHRQVRDDVVQPFGNPIESKLQAQARHPAGAADQRKALPIQPGP